MKTEPKIRIRIHEYKQKIKQTKSKENIIVYRCLIEELYWVLGEEK